MSNVHIKRAKKGSAHIHMSDLNVWKGYYSESLVFICSSISIPALFVMYNKSLPSTWIVAAESMRIIRISRDGLEKARWNTGSAMTYLQVLSSWAEITQLQLLNMKSHLQSLINMQLFARLADSAKFAFSTWMYLKVKQVILMQNSLQTINQGAACWIKYGE